MESLKEEYDDPPLSSSSSYHFSFRVFTLQSFYAFFRRIRKSIRQETFHSVIATLICKPIFEQKITSCILDHKSITIARALFVDLCWKVSSRNWAIKTFLGSLQHYTACLGTPRVYCLMSDNVLIADCHWRRDEAN